MSRRYPYKKPSFKTQSLYLQRGSSTQTVQVEMHEELYEQVREAAAEAGKSAETFLKDLLGDYCLEGQQIIDHQSVEHLLADRQSHE